MKQGSRTSSYRLPPNPGRSSFSSFHQTLLAGASWALLLLGPLGIPASPAQAETVTAVLTEGTNFAAAVSPNREQLVIDLQGALWVLPSSGGEATAITDFWGDSRQPDWSKDGSQIAFQSYRDGNWHIWTVRPDGTDPRQLTQGKDDHREPTWSPDGRTLAFASDRSGNYDIWLFDVGTGKTRQITRDEGNDYGPVWSPDGKALAFVSERSPKGLWMVEALGRADDGATLIASHSATLASPSWSPDGSVLTVRSHDRRQSATELLSVKAPTATGESGDANAQTGSDPGVWSVLSAPGSDVFPFRSAWLSDREFLYTADGQLKRGHLDGPSPSSVKAIPFTAKVKLDRPEYKRKERDLDGSAGRPALGILHPVVSPDGQRVAFAALGDLWIREPDGALNQLTDDVFIEAQPDWSKDGKSLAYVSDRNGQMDIWLRDLDSGTDELLVGSPVSEANPTFSPSGKQLAFYADDPSNPLGSKLLALDLESGTTEPLYERSIQPTEISWAREGAVAVTLLQADSSRFREGTYQIMVLSASEPRMLDPLPGSTIAQMSWSPDQRHIALVQDGVLRLASVDERGSLTGPPETLANELAESVSWSADGQTLVYQSGNQLRRIRREGGSPETLSLELSWQPRRGGTTRTVHAGRMFDGRSETVQTNVDIVLDGNRIARVVAHDENLHTEGWIDASGKTVMPGLFEMHAHQSTLLGEELGRAWLSFGITSVREPGSNAYDALERRESWSSGRRPGPREFFAGPLFDGNRVYYSVAEGMSSRSHVQLALERARQLDYDMIKTYVRLPDEEQRMVLEYAHSELGIPTSSHEVFPAAAHGMDAVEHAGATSRRGYSPKQSSLGISYQDVVEILAKARMNQTPTLVLPGYFLQVAETPQLFEVPQFQAFYSEMAEPTLQRAQMMKSAPSTSVTNAGRTSAAVVAAGGRITAGTDSPFVPYGFGLHVELQLLARGGLEPWQVLRSATAWAADAVGVGDHLGTIEAGKIADLIIVDGNPLENIADTLKVETTIKDGLVFQVEDLLKQP